jgi:hypothetical protein
VCSSIGYFSCWRCYCFLGFDPAAAADATVFHVLIRLLLLLLLHFTNYQLPITKWPHQSEAPVGADLDPAAAAAAVAATVSQILILLLVLLFF